MRIIYVAGVRLSPQFEHDKITLEPEPANFVWELREANGLARIGHTIFWTSPTSPLKADAPEIVFCAADKMSRDAIQIGQSFGLPVVLQMISRPADYPDEIWDGIKEAMVYSQAITCVSPVVLRGTQEWAKQNGYSGIVRLVPHGCDVDLANSVPEQERTHFVYVGALFGHKRVDWLIRAAARTGLPLVVVGDGPERQQLDYLKKIYNAPVEFKGYVKTREVFLELKKAKALLHASQGEQFWLVAEESLACNTRVICHYLPDVHDTYREALTYFRDFDELCRLMETFWHLSDTFGGKEWLEKLGLSLEARSRGLEELFGEVIAGGK